MVASDDGFVLAQKDLELRGPGDIIGTRQSGLPELGWLEQGFDSRLLDVARETAEKLLARDPGLDAPELLRLKLRMVGFWAETEPDEGLS
jgi:ATP-dependent DNA helicase RecG